MKSGFMVGLLTGFALAALAMGWFIAAHRIVPPADKPAAQENVSLPVPAHASASDGRKCAPVYFASTVDGKITQITPLNERYLHDSALVTWAAQAVTDALTFGFHDWLARMQVNAIRFSPEGWQEFHNALAARGLGAKTVENRQIYSTIPARAPVIRRQGVKDGIFVWTLDVPVTSALGTEQNPRGTSETYNVSITVQRARDLTKPAGVEISGFRFVDTAR